jgi:hypothetical protein
MRRFVTAALVIFIAGTAFAKDKPRVTVQIVDAQTSARESTYTVAGSPAVSKTTCNESGNQTIYGKDNGRTVKGVVDTNKTSTCTTVSQPAVPPTTRVRSIRQENMEAVLADGTHVTLWCQQGFRKCVSLKPGSYSAELDGNTVWIFLRDLSGKEGKIKYKAVSIDQEPAPADKDDAA